MIFPPRGPLTPNFRFPYFLASPAWASGLLGGQPPTPRAGVLEVRAPGMAGGELIRAQQKYELTKEHTLNPESVLQTVSGHDLPVYTINAFKYSFLCLCLSPVP